MDPLTWTTAIGFTALGAGAVLAGTGNAWAMRPPTPSPATLRRAGRLTAAGTLAGAVALGGTTTAAADQLPPDIPASIPSAAPGPDNQAPLPDGRPWMDAVAPWGTTDQHATRLTAPEAAPKRPARTRPTKPRRPSTRSTLPRRTTRTGRIVVQPGQTLGELARAHGTTVDALVTANRGRYPALTADYVQARWRLRLPGGAW